MADIKLLLVEDDKNLAFMEKNTLEDIVGGYEIVTASNGKDGIKAWESFKPDVIISDIDMPIMNGIDMVKYIRELDGETIIMFTTNFTAPSKLKEGYEAGVDEYIKKPFVPEELDCHIKALLKLKGGLMRRNVSDWQTYLRPRTFLPKRRRWNHLFKIEQTRNQDLRAACQE